MIIYDGQICYPHVTTYPDRMTTAVIRTKRNMMVENTMRVMVGLARGPNDEVTVAMLPLRDLSINCQTVSNQSECMSDLTLPLLGFLFVPAPGPWPRLQLTSTMKNTRATPATRL